MATKKEVKSAKTTKMVASKKSEVKKTNSKNYGIKGEKPGIINVIISLTKTFISKEAILDKLTKRFPDREPAKMKNTINANLSWALAGRGFKVEKNEKKQIKVTPPAGYPDKKKPVEKKVVKVDKKAVKKASKK